MAGETNDLLLRWKNRSKPASDDLPKHPPNVLIEPTGGQKRLWFFQQAHPGSKDYNYGTRYFASGPLDLDKITKTWAGICQNYNILRSYFPLMESKPALLVAEGTPEVECLDYSNDPDPDARAEEYEYTAIHRSYDLTTPFLCSLLIIRTGPQTYRLTFAAHHILVDEWSVAFLFEKLGEGYRTSITDKKNHVDFRDIAWQEMQQDPKEHLEYWSEYINGAQKYPGLPTDFPRTRKNQYAGTRISRNLPRTQSAQIQNLAKKSQLTLFELTFGVFALLLYRYGGVADFLIGSPVTKRNSATLLGHIGYLIETVLFRFSFNPSNTLESLMDALKEDNRSSRSKFPVPLEALVSNQGGSRDLSRNPLFEIMFVALENSGNLTLAPDVVFVPESNSALNTSKFDLTLFAGMQEDRLRFEWEYKTDLFSKRTIELLADGLEELLKGILEMGIHHTIGNYPVLSPDREKALLQKAARPTHPWDHYPSIPARFEEIAYQFPERIALSFKGASWTYGQLDAQSTLWARTLHHKNPDRKPVALCLERSHLQIIAVLAVLKSGAPYLALDPDYPEARQEYMLENSKVAVLVYQEGSNMGYLKCPLHLSIEELGKLTPSKNEPLPLIEKQDKAYIIYTSGSSGKPKGVAISHANLLYSTAVRTLEYPGRPEVFYWTSSLSFDSSKAGMYWTLLDGGHLHVAPSRSEQEIPKMCEEISALKVTHLLTLPSIYRNILKYGDSSALKSLTNVIVAGEGCDPEVIDQHFTSLPETILYNEYGPSEATVWATVQKLDRKYINSRVPIGKPIAGTRVFILDKSGNLAPPLAVGELCISGPGVTQGYLNAPELTANKFVDNPWGEGDYGKMYRTGDLSRWTLEGELEYFGRKDFQLKIRGQRVELEEIETVFSSLAGVLETVVVAHVSDKESSSNTGDSILVCYYLGSSSQTAPEAYRSQLTELLPAHMVPRYIVQLDEFPRLPNGKIDRRKLSQLKPLSTEQKGTLPSGRIAIQIAELFGEVTDRRPIFMEDNYFDLGGDSIKSIEFISKARARGLMITPNQLFNHPTVEALAGYLVNNEEEEWDFLVGFRTTGSRPPLFCIHAGGGHVFFYKDLTRFLQDRPVYGLQPLGAYRNQELQQTVTQMATDYLQSMRKVQKKGPYLVLVYCFSAVVANEMSRLLRASGESMKLIVADTMTAPASLNSLPRLEMRVLAFASRLIKSPVKTLYSVAVARYSVLRTRYRERTAREEEERRLEQLRIHLMKLSKGHPFSTMTEDIHLLLTEKDHRSVNRETIDSWKRITSGAVKIHPVPGKHMTLFDQNFIETTAKAIQHCLDAFERPESNL